MGCILLSQLENYVLCSNWGKLNRRKAFPTYNNLQNFIREFLLHFFKVLDLLFKTVLLEVLNSVNFLIVAKKKIRIILSLYNFY